MSSNSIKHSPQIGHFIRKWTLNLTTIFMIVLFYGQPLAQAQDPATIQRQRQQLNALVMQRQQQPVVAPVAAADVPAPFPAPAPAPVLAPPPLRSAGGGGLAKKADLSILGSLNDLFGKVADARALLQQRGRPLNDPLKEAAGSAAWPTLNKNAKSKPAVTELSLNDPGKYFHGDVDLTPHQANTLLDWIKSLDPTQYTRLESSGGRRKRKVGQPPAFELWSINPIPYDFDGSMPTGARGIIRAAIKMWESNTCRRWVEGGPGQDRLRFENGGGCSSFIGYIGGTQEVTLHSPGCDVPGIAAHEIGHSLGFFHEQSRPDQVDNVKINYGNIKNSVQANFVPMKLRDVNYYSEPYDFGSVMHYDGLTAGFNKNGNEHTIVTLDPLYQNTIGQRVELSFIDVKQINKAYCSTTCGSLNPNGCQFGGYADPNNCNQCKCPSGFGGPKCQTVAHSTIPNCGGILQATKNPQFFTSPNYPRSFPTGGYCYWMLKAPTANSKVYIEFVETFAFPCEDTCSTSYVEVKRGPEYERTGYRLCCDTAPDGQPLVSQGQLMAIILSTNGDATAGFKIRYYSDAGTGTVPPPIATSRPGGSRRPIVGGPSGPKPPAGGWVTPPPGPGATQPPGCNCGEWGAWGGCSQSCGGCGYIRRQRPCSQSNCLDIEKKHCNFNQCPSSTHVMFANNEFNFLVGGCCIGMLPAQGVCGGIRSTFTQLISSIVPTGRRR